MTKNRYCIMNLNEAIIELKEHGYICERVVNGNMPKYFYHGTPKKNLELIRKMVYWQKLKEEIIL